MAEIAFATHRIANMLAVRAMRHAADFRASKDDAAALAAHADRLQLDLMIADPASSSLLDPVRLLNVAMMRTARAYLADPQSALDSRAWRWLQVMNSLVELVDDERRRFAREHEVSA
ncbi:hypothetical protein XI06_15265 [Bradyrhizobium sp. CCBAU 11434]|uniref:hypothetical protein n=1 Tax=Bradyrhizobium sp. CCBAU 11434 TaxID=1630885 RepID=UPI002305220D|nr:hypothetical protein [Bradyrhizobium sp. CCBAU 11434]MDA9521663.1 hypothetical protein [Bradyrhizobium sp. CCBAU 11434]